MKRIVPALWVVSAFAASLFAAGCEGNIGTSGAQAGGGPSATGSGTGVQANTGTGTSGPTGSSGANSGSGSTGSSGSSATGSGNPGMMTAAGNPSAAGVRPLRLLTRHEYLNTVRDLLSDTTTVTADGLPAEDDPSSDYAFHTTADVATLDATLYQQAAESLAAAAVGRLSMLLPCAASASTTNDASCLTTFMTTLAQKAYRRPLVAAEKTKLMTLYNLAKAPAPNGLALNFASSIGVLLEAMLQSSEFLYHWQVDATSADVDTAASTPNATVIRLGNYEIANRLSYFMWGTMPDQMLFDLAAQGQLTTPTVVEAQVRRMLKDTAQAGAMFSDFFVDWLDLDKLSDVAKDAAVYPQFTPTVEASMLTEARSFVSTAMTTGTGRLTEILTGTNSFANGDLAPLYGLSGITGSAFKPVSLNPMQRSGLLTSVGFMTLTGANGGSNPPRRGKVVLNKLLCQTLPPPPPVVPDPQPITPGVTTRQRFEQHSSNPCAGACHQLLDPLGFAFENYDGIGQYRTTDNNLPVNASVTLTLDGQALTVPDAKGLLAALSTSDQAQSCFATQWFRYALGRQESADDASSIDTASRTFKGASGDVRELVVGVSTSRTFRYRTMSTGEVLQ